MPKAASPQPAATEPPRSDDESIKETFESIVIAFILAFVFRAYVVEAFVIPTGSMAPTLLGEHIRVTCEQCGYDYHADPEKHEVYSDGFSGAPFFCPMCHFPNQPADGTAVNSGDRILVYKYIYNLHEPSRFDVVVFKSPHTPGVNYIKRLVGLPGQLTLLMEGNVYYLDAPAGDATNWQALDGWKIARKLDEAQNADAVKIQRAVWQPLYHSRYVPLDFDAPSVARRDRWRVPWRVTTHDDAGRPLGAWAHAEGDEAELDPHGGYRFEGGQRGVIRLDFGRIWRDPPGYYPYSQHGSAVTEAVEHPVEDVRIAATVTPRGDGLGLRLRTTARMDDAQGVMRVLIADIAPDGTVRLLRKQSRRAEQEEQIGQAATVGPLKEGQSRRVELWYVDQEAIVWVDDEPVLRQKFDKLTMRQLVGRARPGDHTPEGMPDLGELRTPDIAIELRGPAARLRDVDVDQDLYYTLAYYMTPRGRGPLGKGLLQKFGDGTQPRGGPVYLEADHFFCLGDNSPFSHDGRAWPDVDPWVMLRTFREGLTEQEVIGVVPRRLMMGKAFFVYFPAPYGLSETGFQFIPNFGDMRFIY